MKPSLIIPVLASLALGPITASPAQAKDAMLVAPPTLSSAAARKLLAQGIAIAEQRGYHLCLAIDDAKGNLLAFDRQDDASPGCVEAAMAKARSAAANGVDTEKFLEFAQEHNPSLGAIPGIIPAVAGDVIHYDGAIVGSVGVAGGPSDAEETRFAGELRDAAESWFD